MNTAPQSIVGFSPSRHCRALLVAASLLTATAGLWAQSGLVVHYPFDGNANDASGNGHNATVISENWTADRFAQPGSAYTFSGTGNYINLGSWALGSNFSISGWIKYSTWGSVDPMVLLFTNSDDINLSQQPYPYGWHWTYDAIYVNFDSLNHKLNFGIAGENGSGGGAASTTAFIADGNWAFLTVTANGTDLKIYRNAVEVATGTSTVPARATTRTTQHLGTIGPGTSNAWFNGSMDDFRIYNTALSAAEVQNLYAIPEPSTYAALGGLAALLFACWRRRAQA